MKKRLLMLLAFGLSLASSVLADEKYLVGDGTSIGWVTGDKRQLTKMTETSPGVFVWTGPLKHGNEGFKINSGENYVDPTYHPSSADFAMGDTGTDNYKTDGGDTKWNPTATEWTTYTITLDTNAGTLSWSKTDINPLTTEADGYIYISTAEELNKLALMCKCSVNRDQYKVKLTNDIDYTAYKDGSTACIGLLESNAFNGEFDGQNHTITIDMTTYSSRFGLFGTVNGTVHNLKVAGKITATRRNQIGGICGLLKGDGNKIYNCISAVEINDSQSGDGTIGGICAVTYDASTIENCAFYGKISAPNRDGCGGIAGWCNAGASTTIKNCLVVADINWSAGENYGRNNPSVINSFRVDASNADLANGQMTYTLNNKVSGGENWFQTLGTDVLPSPLSSSQKVYANGSLLCDGVTPKGGDVVLGNTNESVIDPHTFGEDGVCTVCKAAGEEATEVDGVFQLTKAGNLLWWAQYVNAGHPASNAVLTTDADLSAAKYTPAGTTENKYIGTFDGQGHDVTLNINNPTLNYQGLFGVATDGATIKNVTVKGSVKGNSYVAGILGGSNGYDDSKKLTLINCGNEAEITASEANGAGLIGVNMSGMAHFYMLNCYNAGNVTSGRESGAITGWSGGNRSTFTNVYNIGTVVNGDGDGFMRGGGNLVNTYNLSATDTKVTSGELCYKLNDSQSPIVWYQKLGEGGDAHPVLKAREDAIVYLNATYLCPNKYEGEVTYSNTESDYPAHGYVDGICTICGGLDENYMTATDGIYEIGTQQQLRWFAAYVNNVKADANAILTADIALSSAWTTSIGTQSVPFKGIFDGQNHAITGFNLTYDGGRQGLFGQVDGATVKNFSIAGTITANGNGGSSAGLGVIAWAESSTIQNVHSSLIVDATGTGLGSTHVGGVVGSLQRYNRVERCSFSGEMNGGSNKVDCFGCVVGYMNDGSVISNCANYGKLTYSGSEGNAGGILAYTWANQNGKIENCLNTGEIDYNASNNGGAIVGWLRDYADRVSNNYILEDCASQPYGGQTDSGNTCTIVTAEQLASGEVCFGLGSAWHQVLGTDDIPTPLDSNKPSVYQIAVGSAGYASFVPMVNVAALPEGVTAYAGQNNGTYLHLEPVAELPAENAYIVKAEEGKYYYNNTDEPKTLSTSNDLVYSDEEQEADGTQYCLANKAQGVGFYKVAAGTRIPAYKAYLQTAAGVKAFYGFDEDLATGIETVNGQSSMVNGIYNLAGQRLQKMQRGVNIIGGKKIVKP